MSPEWIAALVALIAAVLTGLGWLLRIIWKAVRRIGYFLDDYAGEPARDGMPAKPGFMARLAAVEKSLDHVVAETSPNHGRSIRDVVIQTAADVAELKAEQERRRPSRRKENGP